MMNTVKKRKLDINKRYYIYNEFLDTAYKVSVINEDDNGELNLQTIEAFDGECNSLGISGGQLMVDDESQLFDDIDGLKDHIDASKRTKIENYIAEIENIADLFEFPLKHPFQHGIVTDKEAIKAYVLKAEELLGIKSALGNKM